MEENFEINVRPDVTIYSAFKHYDYKIHSALAEFIDNSYQSFFDHKDELKASGCEKLTIDIKFIKSKLLGDKIIIEDNAFGMNKEELEIAMFLGTNQKENQGRNEFGLGLKYAACWFGQVWTVETTRFGSDKLYKVTMDLNELNEKKSDFITATSEKTDLNKHFTRITISKLHIESKFNKEEVTKQLSSVFRVNLRENDFEIIIDEKPLKRKEFIPYKDYKGRLWKDDHEFSIKHKDKNLLVKGFIASRDIGSSVDNEGFALIRRGRVITVFKPIEIFGSGNSIKQQRLYGEWHMDNWPVVQKKDAFKWEDDNLKDEFINKIKSIGAEMIKFAANTNENRKIFTYKYYGEQELYEKTIGKKIKNEKSIKSYTPNHSEIHKQPNLNSVMTTTKNDSNKYTEKKENKKNENIDENKISIFYNIDDKNQIKQYLFDLNEQSNNEKILTINDGKYFINFEHVFFKNNKNPEISKPLIKLLVSFALAEDEALKHSTCEEDGAIIFWSIRHYLDAILKKWED